MNIGGFVTTTLLDYPGKLACTVFLSGCNFRCPFCQNGELVLSKMRNHEPEEVLSHLKKRQGILEGVCVTGGEPTLSKELPDFLASVKELGYAVKLDTNGSHPEVLISLFEKNLIDYIAMDIKSSPANYARTCGVSFSDNLAAIRNSIDFIMHSGLDYEFRTTLVKGLHTPEDMSAICQEISGAKAYYLQSYVESERILNNLYPENAGSSLFLSSFSKEELSEFLTIAQKRVPNTMLRGIE